MRLKPPRNTVRKFLLLAGMVSMGLSAVKVEADQRSDTILDKFYESLGGRAVWAGGRGEYVLAKVKDPRVPLPGTFEFCWSWESAQISDRTRFQGQTQVRSFDGKTGYTFRKPSGDAPGQISEWTEERKQRGLQEWSGNFEILTHRMAKRDPAVSTRMGEGPWEDWIAITVDGNLMSYLLIGSDGAPKKFHRIFDKISVNFGPLADRGNFNFPAWGSFEGGEPFDLIAFEILTAAPTRPFKTIDAGDPGYMDCR